MVSDFCFLVQKPLVRRDGCEAGRRVRYQRELRHQSYFVRERLDSSMRFRNLLVQGVLQEVDE